MSAYSDEYDNVTDSERTSLSDINTMSYATALTSHYARCWCADHEKTGHQYRRMHELAPDFGVLIFPPHADRNLWTYATCCMSERREPYRIELHLFSPSKEAAHVELLVAVAHFHRTGARLDLGHTVNFGRPWMPGSSASFGLLSLPYLDGPSLENPEFSEDHGRTRCLWLIPITESERVYKQTHGLEALETIFDQGLAYDNPQRPSMI